MKKRPTPTSIISKLRKGSISINQIDWKDFQEIVYTKIVQDILQLDARSVCLSNRYKREIDIVIEEPAPKLPPYINPGHPQLHFIECKHYKRDLELDHLGKIFCAAIRYYPKTLTLIASSSLQRQASDYARHFFGDNNVKGVIPTTFSLVRIEEILGGSAAQEDSLSDRILAYSQNVRQSEYSVDKLALIKRSVFSNEFIPIVETGPTTLTLDPSSQHELHIWIKCMSAAEAPRQASIVTLSQASPQLLSEPKIDGAVGGVFRMRFKLQPTFTPPIIPSSKYAVEISASDGGKEAVFINLPELIFGMKDEIFPDMRNQLTDEYSERLVSGSNPALIFISGEAGVGKTYFCSRICQRLKENVGYHCLHFSVYEGLDQLLFYQMLLSILFPADIEERERRDDFSSNLVRSYLSRLLELDGRFDAKKILDRLLKAQLSDIDIQALVVLCARALLQDSQPKILLFTNCQNMSPLLISTFQSFLTTLGQSGWAHVRILCEFRNTPDEENPEWTGLIQSLTANFGERLDKIHIEPLTRSELEAAVSQVVAGPKPEKIADILFEKTGGNSLFIDQLVRQLISEKIVMKREGGNKKPCLVIRENERLAEEIRHLPDKVMDLLLHRLRFIDQSESSNTTGSVYGAFLGLAALCGENIDIKRINRALGCNHKNGEEILSRLYHEKILTTCLQDGRPTFVHDMMRMAARRRAREIEKFVNYGKAMLRILKHTDMEDLITAGTLNVFFYRLDFALERYNKGFEIARGRDDFRGQRRCLDGMRNIYEASRNETPRQKLEYMEILQGLGWTEINAGSMRRALGYYQRALTYLFSITPDENIWTPSLVRRYRTELNHSIMGISVDVLKPISFINTARAALDDVVDVTTFGKILNRVILYCFRSGLASEGWHAGKLATKYACYSNDPEVYAVLCRDIGRLLLADNITASVKLEKYGINTCKSARQALHNQFGYLVAKLHCSGKLEVPHKLDKIRCQARDLGVSSVLARVYMYQGFYWLFNDNTEMARNMFRMAEDIVVRDGRTNAEIQIFNNLGICHLLRGENAQARRYFFQAYELYQEFAHDAAMCAPDIGTLVFNAEQRANKLKLGKARGNATFIRYLPSIPPRKTGIFAGLISNLQLIARAGSFDISFFEENRSRDPHNPGGETIIKGAKQTQIRWNGMSLQLIIE